jgi:uncharacterized protein YggE
MNRYLLAVVLAALPFVALSQSGQPSSPYLGVKGHAERSVEPDRFAIDLHVAVVDMKPVVARTRVEQLMASVLEGFKAHHALTESVDASSLSITSKSDYKDDERIFKGTEVSRTAHGVFAHIDDLRQFIDGIAANEELQITGVTVTRSDMASLRLEVRRDAIKDSIRAAKSMADAYGVKLGSLYTVTDQPIPGARGFYASDEDSSTSLSVMAVRAIDLKVGSIKVEENVFAVYLMDTSK